MMLAWMLYVTVVSLLLAGAAFAAERAAQIRGGTTRWAWAAGIVASLLLPTVIASVSVQLPRLPGAPAGLMLAAPFPLRQMTMEAMRPSAWLDTTIGPLAQAPSVDAVLARLWLVASAAIFLAILANGVLLQRRQRAWERREIEGSSVFVSPDVGPAVVGLLRPRIVIPHWIAEAPAETRTLVLAHERSHLEARDAQLLAVAILLIVTMPWNLPLWWQLRRLRLAIEMDCDARVLKGGHDVGRYGETLIMVGERPSRRIAVVAAMSESKSFLEQRIRKMLRKPTRLTWAGASALATLALVLAASAAEVSPPNAGPTTTHPAPAGAAAASDAGVPTAYSSGPHAKVSVRLVDDPKKTGDERVTGPDGRALWLAPGEVLTPEMFASAQAALDPAGEPVVNFTLTPEGRKRLAEVTRRNVGKRMALIVYGKVRWAPMIRDEIAGGAGQIDGMSPHGVEVLAREINEARRAP
jgi:beta-lactamase regulating signal transducer with metallopeptidase domain